MGGMGVRGLLEIQIAHPLSEGGGGARTKRIAPRVIYFAPRAKHFRPEGELFRPEGEIFAV